MHALIDLLENAQAEIPDGLGDNILVIRSYAVPNDHDLALQMARRILDGIQDEISELTIFIPFTVFAFGMVLTLGQHLHVFPRVFVQQGNELVGLLEFIQKETEYGTPIQLRTPE